MTALTAQDYHVQLYECPGLYNNYDFFFLDSSRAWKVLLNQDLLSKTQYQLTSNSPRSDDRLRQFAKFQGQWPSLESAEPTG